MSSDDRREEVLAAAVPAFAKRGLHGTSTEDVASAAGISQAYLFKMFPTKKALFIALVEHCYARVTDVFIEAVGDATGDEALDRIGAAYGELLRDRNALMLQMQAYAASDDPEIGAVTRREFGKLYRLIQRMSGESDECLQQFMGIGMLMNVMAALDATSHPSQWVKACVPPAWLSAAMRPAS
jgi:AcrR family transcriptional regulator